MELIKETVTTKALGLKKVINREYRLGNDMINTVEHYFMGIRYRFVSNTRPFMFMDALRGFGKNNIDIGKDSNINIEG